MIRKLPILPTMLVALAVAAMIALGVWQLQRAKWKEDLIARYQAAQKLPPISFPTGPVADDQLPLFRYATGLCLRPVAKRSTAGRNLAGESGYAHIVDCMTGAEGPGMSVEVGWSKNPNVAIQWRCGPVSGIIAPDSRTRMRLVAATAPPGLLPSAPPSVDSVHNNHRYYAWQWFLFALIALVIYVLALRGRRSKPGSPQ